MTLSDQFADYHSFNPDDISFAWGPGPYQRADGLKSTHPAAYMDASEQPMPAKGTHSIQVIPSSSNSRARAQIEFVM